MIDAKALIALFEQALSEEWGYIWGGRGQEWTKEKQAAAKRDMTVKYGAQWIGRRVADCSGLFAWAFDELGGSIYHGSNTIWNKWCTIKGTLVNGGRSDGLPLKPGTAVFLKRKENGAVNRHHIGLYIGDSASDSVGATFGRPSDGARGVVIEAKGTRCGVVVSDLSTWHEWGELKNVLYEGSETTVTLKQGDKGAAVARLQALLMAAGCALPNYGADGDFGGETERAVKEYQQKAGLAETGVADRETFDALNKTSESGGDVTLSLRRDIAKALAEALGAALEA